MFTLTILLSTVVVAGSSLQGHSFYNETTAYNYHSRIGIPEATRIKEHEKKENALRIIGGWRPIHYTYPYQNVFADEDFFENNTAYGYFEKFGIPEANRIRAIEEKYVKLGARIVGGTSTNLGQYPWQAGLIIDFATIDGIGVCGASLISPDRLVTAAHCWFDGQNQASKYTVVLGSTFLFYSGERFVTNIVVTHPKWIPLLVRNDIAVIYLTSPVTFSDVISPIALAKEGEDFNGNAITSGYGLTSDKGSINTDQTLSHLTVKVISNSLCWWAFPGVIQNFHICTSGVGGVGACGGDSGGPLFITLNGKTTLIGVTSFGSALGCSAGLPTVYTRISSYGDFIEKHLD